MEASRLAPTPKPITISGSSRTRPDYSGMRSGCSGERKCRYGSSHSPDLKSGTFERAAPTAADPKETMSSKRVVGSSENRAEVGAGFSFGLRKCRWAALGVPQSDPGSPVLRPWPETSATCRIPCISSVQGLPPPPHGSPRPSPPLYCFLSFLPPCFDHLPARRTRGSADLGAGGGGVGPGAKKPSFV